jgi:hypothetical protein
MVDAHAHASKDISIQVEKTTNIEINPMINTNPTTPESQPTIPAPPMIKISKSTQPL